MAKVIYTSVTQKYNKIFFRGYKDGKRIQYSNITYKPCLYSPTNDETGFRSLHGKNLVESTFESIGEAKAYIKQYKDVQQLHGNTNWEYDFIHRNFKGEQHVTISDLTVLSCDIETTVGGGLIHGKSNFPDVFDPHDEVLLITLQNINTSELVTFGCKPYSGTDTNYVLCRDESDLLTKFIDYIIDTDPDIITGWNVIKFDFAYLGSRIVKILGQRALDRLSPFNTVERKIDTIMDKEHLRYDIQGRTVLDLLELYKKFRFINRPSYRLESIGQVELGEGKHKFDCSFKEMYTDHWQTFVQYNVQDVVLVSKLEQKLGMVYLAVVLAYLNKVNFDDVYSPVRTWESYILSTLYEENTFCELKRSNKSDHQIVGGYVKEPIPGMYKWNITFDATSLYPSIIMSLNMSPETLVDMIDLSTDQLLNGFKPECNDYAVAANGARFRKDTNGVMARLTKKVFDERKAAKNKMLQLKKEYEVTHDAKTKLDSARYGVLQLALKVSANSLFGVCSNQYFMFFDNRIAEGITMTGQYIIQEVQRKASDYIGKIVKSPGEDFISYSDTDSLSVCMNKLVKMNPKKLTDSETVDFLQKFVASYMSKELDSCTNSIASTLNMYDNRISFKTEGIASTLVVLAKKRNMQKVLDNEGVRYSEPDYKVTGIETNRSSTPDLVREWLMDAIKLVLDDCTRETLVQYIDKRRSEFKTYSVEEIAFPRSANNLTKFSDRDNIYTAGTPIAVRAALLYNNLVKKLKLDAELELIQEGQKILYTALIEPNTLKENVIGFPVELPKQFNLHRYVDYDTQFQKAFLDPLTKIMDAMNWKYEEVESLDSFF